MSYILDALRKAEHERNLGDAPRLEFPPLSDSAPRRPWVLWILVAVLGVCVGILGAMQLSQRLAEAPAESARPPAAEVARAPAAEPAQAPPPAVEPAPAEQAPPEPVRPQRRAVQVNTPQGPVEIEMPMADEPPSQPARPEPAPRSGPPPAPEVESRPEPATEQPPASVEIPSPAELAAEMEGSEPATLEPDGDTAAEAVPAPEPEPEPSPEPEAVEEEQLVSYLGLPSGVRSSIGELAMNAHVYSSTPGRGFCIINGRRYRPGDQLEEGPVLQEIRLDGAVLEYRGERFLLPVPR